MRVGLGDIAIVAEDWAEPIDVVGVNQDHHLQLALLPDAMNASGCYANRWAPHRFERVGQLFLFPAREEIHARSTCRTQRSIVCRLRPDALAGWCERDMEWTDRRLSGSLDITSPSLRRLVWRIGDELLNPGFGREAMVELLAGEVAIELARYFLNVQDGAAGGGLAPWRLRLIDDCLADNASGASLAELANLCNLSVRHLARAFRVSRGCSLGDHIAAQRIAQARRMLGQGCSVKETAFAVGFTAPTNFAAAFRRATGETPRQYRQRTVRPITQ